MIKKTLLAIAALTLAAAAHADTTSVLTEGFETGIPTGWTQANALATGDGWFADSGVLTAQAGSSYAGSNFNVPAAAGGNFDVWLITPELNLISGASISFFTKTADAGFFDGLEVLFSSGSSTALSSFSSLLTIGAGALPTDWSQFTTAVADYTGAGRFAFRHTGNSNTADFVGIDSVSVITTAATTDVPEPASLALMGLGVAGLIAARRKQQRA
jgi:hypothetical protein